MSEFKVRPETKPTANDATAHFADASNKKETCSSIWRPIKVDKEDIGAEIERLKSLKMPANDLRRSYIVHPQSTYDSFTPGIRLSIEVIMPGETVELPMTNSSSVGFCIDGAGVAEIDRKQFEIGKFDVWTVPNMVSQSYRNRSDHPHVRFVFSDAPLLEMIHAHFVADKPIEFETVQDHVRDPMANFVHDMPTGGGAIKTYHAFIDPEVVEHTALVWKWEEVKDFLNGMDKDQPDLRAAIIAMLWNPATGRAHGSTNTLTAWISGGVTPGWTEPKWEMARSHRHSVTALNYAIMGQWKTVVERQEFLWEPGDLVLTAPAWGVHSNGRCDREAYTFTVQDNALHGVLNSTIMQEYMNRPPIHLGARSGFHA